MSLLAFLSSLPVCCPCLIENRSVTKGITQDQRLDSGRFMCVFSKLLSQKASQRSSKKVNLIQEKKKKNQTKQQMMKRDL